LAAVTLGVAWALAWAGGVVDVPRTDDWGFAREAIDLHHTGSFHLINWGPMTKVGHLVWAQPFLWVFGDHQWALAISESVLVAAGIVAAFWLCRRRLGIGQSVLVVSMLLLFPGVVRDAVSYMTDPTALALQLVTLALGAAALRADGVRRRLWFGAALVAGFWGFSIRELAIAAPIAVVITLWSASDRGERLAVAIDGGVWIVACGALWWWHHGLAGVDRYAGRPALGTALTMLVGGTITVAVALAPALAWSLPRWWHTRHATGRAIGAGVGLGVVVARPLLAHQLGMRNWWLVGDYLQSDGMNGGKLLLGAHTQVLPTSLWNAVVVIGCISTVIIGALLGEWAAMRATVRVPHADPVSRLVSTHAGIAAGLLVVTSMWNSTLFDRYLWPLVFSGSLVLLWRDRPAEEMSPRVLVATQYVGALVTSVALMVTVLLTLHSNAFDGARWRLAERVVAAGTPATMVDGGTEWDGTHSTLPNRPPALTVNDPLVAWWTSMTSMPQVCMVITNSPVASPLGREVDSADWNTWLLFGHSTLHVYALGAPACTGG
jgi:hypothetical protein